LAFRFDRKFLPTSEISMFAQRDEEFGVQVRIAAIRTGRGGGVGTRVFKCATIAASWFLKVAACFL
jgi:hypothetical protein